MNVSEIHAGNECTTLQSVMRYLRTVSTCMQSFQNFSSFITVMELITALLVCIIIAIFIFKITVRVGGPQYLPGPKFSFPVLGHFPLLGAEPWVTFTQWKKLYGPMFAIKMGSYDVVVLNESQLIKKAFTRPEFSGRPKIELFQSPTEGKGLAVGDGPLVAEQRNFAQKNLQGFRLRTNLLEENIRLEFNQVMEDIEKNLAIPVGIKGMFAIPVINVIWNMFMGKRFEHDDPMLRQLVESLHDIATYTPLAALALFVPAISKLMPELSGLNRKFQDYLRFYAFAKKAFDEPLLPTRIPGDPQNFKEAFIDEMERVGDNLASSFHPTHTFFQYTAGDIFMAAMETTSTTLDWLLLCMAKYPKVQKKVQAEVDDVIGSLRRPALSDKDKTPYVDAVIQELLRYSSIVPLGFLHRTTEDTELGGYSIKKDTLIIANTYGVHYDEDVWSDPENFRPQRFIDASGTVDRNLTRTILPFSTGKRSCIGENLARDQIYLFCTSIFQRFHVSCDEHVTFETTLGFVRAPKDFKLTFTKRFIE